MNQALKDREHATWTSVAPGWKKHEAALSAAYARVTERMLHAAGIRAGSRVLDIACGSGEPSVSAALQVGANGFVLGTDFVEEMLASAREKAKAKGLHNVEFRRVDGEELAVDPGSFDAALSRWGVIFMPEPLACLRRMHGALRTGGRVAIACWAPPAENPWVALVLGAIRKHIDIPAPPPGAPGMFSFADRAKLHDALEQAGFGQVHIEAVPAASPPMRSGAAHFGFVRELAGPVARLVATLDAAQISAIEAELNRDLEAFRGADRISIPGQTWVASGQK